MPPKNEFYVGSQDRAPQLLAGWLRLRIIALLVLVILLAAGLALSQAPFGAGTFEQDQSRLFTGTYFVHPYPMLRLDRPGITSEQAGHSLYFLVGRGKHGIRLATRHFNRKRVSLSGALIYRDNQVMIEVEPNSIKQLEGGEWPVSQQLGEITVSGEIVDSKCFLGVMKPGNLTLHRACAIRCISGGIPPVLLVRDPRGNTHYFTLVNEADHYVNQEVLHMVAKPVRITGKVYRRDNLFFLRANPADYQLIH